MLDGVTIFYRRVVCVLLLTPGAWAQSSLVGGGLAGSVLDSAGVECWEYSSKARIRVDTPQDRLMLNMRFSFAAQESEAASSRTPLQLKAC